VTRVSSRLAHALDADDEDLRERPRDALAQLVVACERGLEGDDTIFSPAAH